MYRSHNPKDEVKIKSFLESTRSDISFISRQYSHSIIVSETIWLRDDCKEYFVQLHLFSRAECSIPWTFEETHSRWIQRTKRSWTYYAINNLQCLSYDLKGDHIIIEWFALKMRSIFLINHDLWLAISLEIK